ncbi:hypothetical protein DFH11DRAFT_1652735 [Phellopilus nigrolimitatus]|nr:hypothetical protein DFH11DRAFT_1652735 [Phellopilus nigrolimitatus]
MMQFFPLLRLIATSLGRKMALKLLHALALRFASCACSGGDGFSPMLQPPAWAEKMALKLLHALALRSCADVHLQYDGPVTRALTVRRRNTPNSSANSRNSNLKPMPTARLCGVRCWMLDATQLCLRIRDTFVQME